MVTIKLTHPITVGGVELKEIQLRRPKVRDHLIVDKMKGSDGEKEVAMIANLSELSKEAIEELDISDYVQIQKALMDFLGSSQGTNS